MKILLLSRYGHLGASSRVRSYQYLPYLEAQGIDVTVAPLLGDDYIKDLYAGRRKRFGGIFAAYLRRLCHLLEVRRFDLLWIEYEILPWLPAWAEKAITYLGTPYVVDYDDAIFHRYDQQPNWLLRNLVGDKIDKVMQRAVLVIVCNDYLAERAHRAGAQRVEYLPTVIDSDRYHSKPQAVNAVFTIGWIGSPATAKYLDLVRPALAEVCRNGNGRLVLVGSGKVEMDEVPLEIGAWSEEMEVANIQSFNAGIMPLQDGPWERGKCGYKLIQYMACGRPVVASPVGMNQRIVEDGVNGFLATTTADWVRALSILRDNYALRERMGDAGRNKIEAQYCTKVTAPRLASLLRSAAKEFG